MLQVVLCATYSALPSRDLCSCHHPSTYITDYVVQGHRYNILEDIGCMPAIYNVTWAYPLVFALPLVLGVVAAGYSGMSSSPSSFLDTYVQFPVHSLLYVRHR
jgi:hypothetical protein